MSHVATVKTKIGNPQALVRALLRVGIPQNRIEIHEQAIQCCGYHKEEKFMANVVVRKDICGSDIGWERAKDGTYVAHIDDYNYGGRQHYSTAWQTQVATYCGIETTKMELDSQSIEYTEARDDRGRTQIRFKLAEDPRAMLRRGR
jgi:hypothetical protein